MARSSPNGNALANPTRAGINRIIVGGYKSIRKEQSIEVRPLTILAGANSSGKSSIMQPLLLLKQTLEAPFDPGPLLLDGPHLQFTLADQILSRGMEEFSLGLDVGEDSLTNFYSETSGKGFD